MKTKRQFYELEFIGGVVRKLTYKGRIGSIYNFEYSRLNEARDLVDLSNGIYFVRKNNSSMEIYVGQTTNGLFRFTEHSMKEFQDTAEIFFHSFEGQKPNKNLLDYIEADMIKRVSESRYQCLNKNKGNKSNIRDIDFQYYEEQYPTILMILDAFGINLEAEVNIKSNEKSDENIFYAKGDGYDFKILRDGDFWIMKKDSLVAAKTRWESGAKDKDGFAVKNFYHKFIEEESIVSDDNRLKRDLIWKSISSLVAFGKGNLSNNGWTEVNNKEGKTPHQIYREEKQSNS